LLLAVGDDAAAFSRVGGQFFGVIGRMGGDLQAVIVWVEEVNAAFAFRPEAVVGTSGATLELRQPKPTLALLIT